MSEQKENNVTRHFQPEGIEFYDFKSFRHMLYVQQGHDKGWLCYKHPDGQWVMLREATPSDIDKLNTPVRFRLGIFPSGKNTPHL